MKSVTLILCVIGVAFAKQSAPVFMWNVNSAVRPALGLVSQNEFADIVSPFLAERPMVVFVEKHLTNRDFSCPKDHSPKSCFAHLQGVSGKNFYTSVDQPIESLQSLSNDIEYSSVDSKGVVTPPLNVENGKITFVRFDDDDTSDRRETLEKHDFLMESITSEFKDKNVFFAYTSEIPKSSSVMRVRRSSAATVGGFIFRDPKDKVLLFYNSIYLTDSKGFKTDLSFTAMTVQETNGTNFAVTLQGTPALTFNVIHSGGYYFIDELKVGGVKYRSNEVYAPTDFSYFCGNLTLYVNDSSTNARTLKWNSFQFQAPSKNIKAFGDPWHCVGFFTGGILSGLLIVALLLSISFVGVCWMMDINTMDRFDDPKGKTITINASD